MRLIPRYKVDDWVIITHKDQTQEFFEKINADNWLEIRPRKINQVMVNEDDKYTDYGEDELIRYRVDGLWFNESELKLITRETDPEYYL